jgi:hypothetical protein
MKQKNVYRLVEKVHTGSNQINYFIERKNIKKKYIFFGPYIESWKYVNYESSLINAQQWLENKIMAETHQERVIEEIDLNNPKK